MTEMNSYKEIMTQRFFRNIFIEFGPIALFAIFFHLIGPYKATGLLMLTVVLSTVVVYRLERRIPYITLYVTFLTILFGYMTLHRHDINFLQIRDSVYDFTLAGTLLVGLIFSSLLLKVALNSYVILTDKAWRFFTYLWILFFFLNGILNEYVRHSFNISQWLTYKIVMIVITVIFTFVALHLTLEHNKKHLNK